jgi:intracellular sulfur oxidation DsrE/DsrF family protein
VPSLERLAVILNLAGLAGLKAQDVQLVAVLHGDATVAALNDAEYERVVGRKHDSAQLIEALAAAGVKIEVCGQSLAKKGYDPKQVRGNVKVAASAATSCLKYQSQGYGFLPEARK